MDEHLNPLIASVKPVAVQKYYEQNIYYIRVGNERSQSKRLTNNRSNIQKKNGIYLQGVIGNKKILKN